MHVLTYIWPHTVPCPTCHHPRTIPRRTRGRLQYRICPACSRTHKITATHAHHTTAPGEPSRIAAL